MVLRGVYRILCKPFNALETFEEITTFSFLLYIALRGGSRWTNHQSPKTTTQKRVDSRVC